MWLHPTGYRGFSRDTSQITLALLPAVSLGFSSGGSTLTYHGLLFMIWLIARTRTASVLRSLLGAREGQQAKARELVSVQVTVSEDTYLLAENTCNYQTSNRKLKIAAPNICPIKCHYHTSTHLSFSPARHPAEVQRSDAAFSQLHFSSLTLLKSPLYFLDGFQSLHLQMGFGLYCNPYSPSHLFGTYKKKCPQLKQTLPMQHK